MGVSVSENELARVYSFDLQFEGSRRTQFYRELFGYRSKTTRMDGEGREKVYENFYPGILTPLPHLRLGKSVIAVPKTARNEVDDFFEDSRWKPRELYSFDGILPPEDRMEAMEDALSRIMVGEDRTLESEIESLLSLESRRSLDPENKHRVRRVLERVEELMGHDWTDGFEFSKRLRERLDPLRNLTDRF
ncbi:hypothetical protein AKJ41_03615 [candidate division MSBL1 archaeon SCGC-AAA259O05]|uniref:Uncharacterized protein n=1 Tax=candidate division MSBL1 archaeon SCGC-AAA259O05 TaxID=1698271 RepID=A0A133V2Z9_9EURY|nr:hypothetical protein AKJ41_03615 [candidate division MSBL1 archaeon SCGC-AAA259O05]